MPQPEQESSGREPLLSSIRTLADTAYQQIPDILEDDVGLWTELRTLVAICGPAVVQLCAQQAAIVSNQMFAGSLGKHALAAASLGFTWFNLMWYFVLGVASALDTLASQAFGANDKPGVVSWAIAATVVISSLGVPMAVALYNGDIIAATLFQQDPEIAAMVGTYCRGIIPGLWPYIWSTIIMKALQAQGMMWIPANVTVAYFLGNLVLNTVFIRLWGFTGVAFAQSASRTLMLLMLIGCVAGPGRGCISFRRGVWEEEEELDDTLATDTSQEIAAAVAALKEEDEDGSGRSLLGSSAGALVPSPVKDMSRHQSVVPFGDATAWSVMADGVSWETLLEFLKLGIPGGFMMAAEGNSYDITTTMAGIIGTLEVDAHTALLTLCEFAYVTLPFGIATAATIRVGNTLGAGRPDLARRSSYMCIGLCMAFECVSASLIFGLRYKIGYAFVDDPDVVALVAKIAPLAAFYQLPDGIYGTSCGILRGMGRQAQLLGSNLVGFWGVGMTLCYVLTFHLGFGVEGLWIGLLTGMFVCATSCAVMIWLVDWDAESRKAQEAASAEAGTAEEDHLVPIDVETAGPAPTTASVRAATPYDPWANLPRRPALANPIIALRNRNSLAIRIPSLQPRTSLTGNIVDEQMAHSVPTVQRRNSLVQRTRSATLGSVS